MNTQEQIASEIKTRIANLFPLQGDNLKGEMDSLKRVLLENPVACSFLHEEDIGNMCIALRKITGTALASAIASKSKPKAEKKKILSEEEMQAALDDM